MCSLCVFLPVSPTRIIQSIIILGVHKHVLSGVAQIKMCTYGNLGHENATNQTYLITLSEMQGQYTYIW